MTTTTDLLRKAARLHEGVAKSAEHRGEPPAVVAGLRRDASSLLALAERMGRPLAQDIKDAITELADGRNYPDLLAAVDLLASPHPAPELTRDAERLDWMQEVQPITFCPHCKGAPWTLYPDHKGEVCFEGMTLRQAIDAAMQEPKP